MGFESLQISEPLKKALSSSVNSGRFPHAAILEDEDGERLMQTAKTLAAALVCSGEGKPCGRCINCLKALSDSHPDIKIFEPDPKTDNFRIETVRELRSDAYIVANEADRKVYILKDAQNMLVPAQNALLKVLEEPPEGVLFLLTADSLAGVLPTIRSRCISFAMAPVSPADCARYCTKQGVDAKAAALYSELFDGHIGTVLDAARDEARRAQVDKALALAKAAAAQDSYAAAVLLAAYEKDKVGAAALLADFRAVAAAGLRGSPRAPVQGDAARKALAAADAAIQRLGAQVNPKITLSVLAAKFRAL